MTSATDFSTLGRLGNAGTPPKSRSKRPRPVRRRSKPNGSFPPRPSASRRRRRHLPRGPGGTPLVFLIVGGVALLTLLVGILGTVAGTQTNVLSAVTVATPAVDPVLQARLLAGPVEEVEGGSVSLVPGGLSDAEPVAPPPPFAAVEDIALHLPLSAPGGVVFMEADNAAAMPLAPLGSMTTNDNPDGFTLAQTFDGPAFAVHAPLSGVRPATGMAAVLAAPGTALVAPVEGTVSSVTSGEDQDGVQNWAVAISPANRPDLYVVIRGLATAGVAVGQAVTAGTTPVGTIQSEVVIDGAYNPLSLPAALVHVQPAIQAVEVLAPQ